ncbi:MAG: hypothetical protein EXR72_27080 [Myxococcales bacterium]|nr:hypothetical protein [Myxococcales bacterium]
MRPVRLLGLLAALAGCSESAPKLGEPCKVLCTTGLTCSATGFCIKRCRCDGGAICNPTSLATGCPPEAACVTAAESGEGMCAVVCDGRACPPGEATCASAPDGTPICVGEHFPWVGGDGGGADRSLTD